MARIIDHTQIAIIYETITGQCQKRGSIGVIPDPAPDEPRPANIFQWVTRLLFGSPKYNVETVNLDAFLERHPGLNVVIVPRADHPGPDGNEHFCRQAIADHTGAPYFPHGADRAVMVHPSGNVVSVHYGNVPGLDHPEPGHRLLLHATAHVGDRIE